MEARRKYWERAAQNILPAVSTKKKPVDHSEGSDKVKTGWTGNKAIPDGWYCKFSKKGCRAKGGGTGELPDGLPRKILYSGEKSEIEQDKCTYPGHLALNDTVSPGKHWGCEGAELLYQH